MKYTEGEIGRVFVLQFEEGDDLVKCTEDFAADNGIATGYLNFTGMLGKGSLKAGIGAADSDKISIDATYEGSAIGLLAVNGEGKPTLHLNGVLGHGSKVVGGYMSESVTVSKGGQAILYEITGASCTQSQDDTTGRTALLAKPQETKKESATSDRFSARKVNDTNSQILHLFNCSIN